MIGEGRIIIWGGLLFGEGILPWGMFPFSSVSSLLITGRETELGGQSKTMILGYRGSKDG